MNNKPLVILISREGRLGHRISRFAQGISWAETHHTTFAHAGFYDYLPSFPVFKGQLLASYPIDPWERTPELAHALFSLFSQYLSQWAFSLQKYPQEAFHAYLSSMTPRELSLQESFELRVLFQEFCLWLFNQLNVGAYSSPLFEALPSFGRGHFWDSVSVASQLDKQKVLLLSEDTLWERAGGVHRDQKLFQSLFKPNDTIRQKALSYLRSLREGCEVLVGVHIRWGDFKILFPDSLYFSTEQHYTLMKKVEALLAPKKVGFVICSDEPQKSEDYPGLNVRTAALGLLEDMYLLSQCDYIISSGSSFSLTSAILGEVPLYRVKHEAPLQYLSEFRPPSSFINPFVAD